MSASASRKNGKQASCEPCRRGKVRCDHRMPVCDRCRRRNIDSECWYHPAPLTRPSKRIRTSSLEDSEVNLTEMNVQAPPSVATVPLEAHTYRTAGVEDNGHSLSVSESNTTSPATLPLLSLQSLEDTNTQSVLSTAMYDDRGNETLQEDLLSIAYILDQLHHCATIRKLLVEYYRMSEVATVPGHLVLPVISDLERIHEDILHQKATTSVTDSRVAISRMAHRILRATTSRTVITSSTTLAEFLSFYSGPNLRVESIGLLFSVAARASRLGLAPDHWDSHDFVHIMLQCSARCLRLARELATEMSDVIVWLSYENLRITTSIQGYSSPTAWRRLGDLSTDIFALQIHREVTIEKVPFFLAECRRRIFAAAFHWDKLLATLFDRPPRIPSYYADCRLPLELTDDQLCLDDPRDEEQASVERTGGWHTGTSNYSASWIRTLYIIAQFKEETLLHHLKPLDDQTRSKLELVQPFSLQTWKSTD
ncbi:hypothetical protein E4T44_10471 [Aureobasidium sp. EXF-8845]|nr:hypothetical protein E4T44_10471 [Aureobasidium sp. EXF-8845]